MTKLSDFTFAFPILLGRKVNAFLGRVGVRIVSVTTSPQFEDVGRTYTDQATTNPNFRLKPGFPKPFAQASTIFSVNNGTKTIEREVFWSHLTLLKMLKHFDFETVLDIGSHAQNIASIFRHVGKKVTTVEVSPGWEADYKEDYLKITFPNKFDAIWCSEVLEHQRNVGQFLDKIFDDLRDGGVLALTVPFELDTRLSFGHCHSFSPLGLLYHLVLAGFDCSGASMKCYNYNIGIIVRKSYNGILRHNSFALKPSTPDKQEIVDVGDKQMTLRELHGDEISDNLATSFPFPITGDNIDWQNKSINWGDPI